LADTILPEATAPDRIARFLDSPGAMSRPLVSDIRVQLVCQNHAVGRILADMIAGLGYRPEVEADVGDCIPRAPLAVWEIPVLEDGWAPRLGLAARASQILALLPFADRDLVARARGLGAAACLDVPWDLEDLRQVLDRLASEGTGPRHRADGGQPGTDAVVSRSRLDTARWPT
jgi:hypothetical protein